MNDIELDPIAERFNRIRQAQMGVAAPLQPPGEGGSVDPIWERFERIRRQQAGLAPVLEQGGVSSRSGATPQIQPQEAPEPPQAAMESRGVSLPAQGAGLATGQPGALPGQFPASPELPPPPEGTYTAAGVGMMPQEGPEPPPAPSVEPAFAPAGPVGYKDTVETWRTQPGRREVTNAKLRLGKGKTRFFTGADLSDDEAFALYANQFEGVPDQDVHALSARLQSPSQGYEYPLEGQMEPQDRRAVLRQIYDMDTETVRRSQDANADVERTLMGHVANLGTKLVDIGRYQALFMLGGGMGKSKGFFQTGLSSGGAVSSPAPIAALIFGVLRAEEREAGEGYVDDSGNYVLTKPQQGLARSYVVGMIDGTLEWTIENSEKVFKELGRIPIGAKRTIGSIGAKFLNGLHNRVARTKMGEAVWQHMKGYSKAAEAGGYKKFLVEAGRDNLINEIVVEEWGQALVDAVDDARTIDSEGNRLGIKRAVGENLRDVILATPSMFMAFELFHLAGVGVGHAARQANKARDRADLMNWLRDREANKDVIAKVLAMHDDPKADPKAVAHELYGVDVAYRVKIAGETRGALSKATGLPVEALDIAMRSPTPEQRKQNIVGLLRAKYDAEGVPEDVGANMPTGKKQSFKLGVEALGDQSADERNEVRRLAYLVGVEDSIDELMVARRAGNFDSALRDAILSERVEGEARKPSAYMDTLTQYMADRKALGEGPAAAMPGGIKAKEVPGAGKQGAGGQAPAPTSEKVGDGAEASRMDEGGTPSEGVRAVPKNVRGPDVVRQNAVAAIVGERLRGRGAAVETAEQEDGRLRLVVRRVDDEGNDIEDPMPADSVDTMPEPDSPDVLPYSIIGLEPGKPVTLTKEGPYKGQTVVVPESIEEWHLRVADAEAGPKLKALQDEYEFVAYYSGRQDRAFLKGEAFFNPEKHLEEYYHSGYAALAERNSEMADAIDAEYGSGRPGSGNEPGFHSEAYQTGQFSDSPADQALKMIYSGKVFGLARKAKAEGAAATPEGTEAEGARPEGAASMYSKRLKAARAVRTGAKVVGSEVTPRAYTYTEGTADREATVKADPKAPKNVWSRPSDDPDNSKRTLCVQFASDLLYMGGEDAGESYFDKLYSGVRRGYARPGETPLTNPDFWEIPFWTAVMAKNLPDADFYAVRNIDEAKAFLAKSGYGRVAFSALDINKDKIRDLMTSAPQTTDVVIGGYVKDLPETFESSDHPNVKTFPTMEAFIESLGQKKKPGVDYRHFMGVNTIPRLALTRGCMYSCAFCAVKPHGIVTDLDAREVVSQVSAIAELGSELAYLNDKTFGQGKNWKLLPKIFKRIRKSNPRFQGFIIQTTAADMNFRRFPKEWLAKSGIRYVELGVESYNDGILRVMRKPANRMLIDRAAQVLREFGMQFIPNIIVGTHWTKKMAARVENLSESEQRSVDALEETDESYQMTMNFLERNTDIVSHANIYNLATYPGTELGDETGTVSEEDLDENTIEKSFHKHPETHAKWYKIFTHWAENLLEHPTIIEQAVVFATNNKEEHLSIAQAEQMTRSGAEQDAMELTRRIIGEKVETIEPSVGVSEQWGHEPSFVVTVKHITPAELLARAKELREKMNDQQAVLTFTPSKTGPDRMYILEGKKGMTIEEMNAALVANKVLSKSYVLSGGRYKTYELSGDRVVIKFVDMLSQTDENAIAIIAEEWGTEYDEESGLAELVTRPDTAGDSKRSDLLERPGTEAAAGGPGAPAGAAAVSRRAAERGYRPHGATDEGRTQSSIADGLSKGERVVLRHWSHSERDTLRVKYHGRGYRGGEAARREGFPDEYVPRLYFGGQSYEKEEGLGDVYSEVEVDDLGLLYDMAADPDRLYEKAQRKAERAYGFATEPLVTTFYEREIRAAGYGGAFNSTHDVAMLFYDVRPGSRITGRGRGGAFQYSSEGPGERGGVLRGARGGYQARTPAEGRQAGRATPALRVAERGGITYDDLLRAAAARGVREDAQAEAATTDQKLLDAVSNTSGNPYQPDLPFEAEEVGRGPGPRKVRQRRTILTSAEQERASGQALSNPLNADYWANAFAHDDTVSSIVIDRMKRPDVRGWNMRGYRIINPQEWAAIQMTVENPTQELFKVAYLDSRWRTIETRIISVGVVDSALVHPREVYGNMPKGTMHVVIGHNHPSGDPTPSAEDVRVAKNMDVAAQIAGVDLADQVTTNAGKYHSTREGGLVTFASKARQWKPRVIPRKEFQETPEMPEKYSWEVVQRDKLTRVLAPALLGEIVSAMRQHSAGKGEYVYVGYLSAKNHLSAVTRIPKDAGPQTIMEQVAQNAGRHGAAAFVIGWPGDVSAETIRDARAMRAQSGNLDIQLLDVVVGPTVAIEGATPAYRSLREEGLLEPPGIAGASLLTERPEGAAAVQSKVNEEVDVPVSSLTPEVLARMDKIARREGFDSRGASDVREYLVTGHKMPGGARLSPAIKNGRLKGEWAAFYLEATQGVSLRADKAAAKSDQRKQHQHIARGRIKELGFTEDLNEAGYITPNGRLIDLSGNTPGRRSYDHREAGGTAGMQEFMAEGNIRISGNAGHFDLKKAPTKEQENVLLRMIKLAGPENAYGDLEDGLGPWDPDGNYYRRGERSEIIVPEFRATADSILNRIRAFYGRPHGAAAVQRPKDQTKTAAFRKWFGKSLVVDKNGKPLIVYHGAEKGGFSIFESSKLHPAIHFAADVYTARTYSGSRDEVTPRYYKTVEDLVKDGYLSHEDSKWMLRNADGGYLGRVSSWNEPVYRYEFRDYEGLGSTFESEEDLRAVREPGPGEEIVEYFRLADHHGNYVYEGTSERDLLDAANDAQLYEESGVYPVYLSLQSPIEYDAEGRNWDSVWGEGGFGSTWDIEKEAERLKADGFIVYNVTDNGRYGEAEPTTVYGVFSPKQIKSATQNVGTFSAERPNINAAVERARADIKNEVLGPESVKGYSRIAKYMTPTQREETKADLAEKIVDVFDKVPEDDLLMAAAFMGERARGWYRRAATVLRHLFGQDAEQFVAVIAATSPHGRLPDNLKVALLVWKEYEAAGRPTTEEGVERVLNNVPRGMIPTWIPNLKIALLNREPFSVRPGDKGSWKVRSFFDNLIGNLQAVTLDVWMSHISGIDQELFGKPHWYYAYSARIRRVAQKMGWEPAEVQETVWAYAKAITEYFASLPVGHRDMPKMEFAAIRDRIENTPEFGTIMLENENVKTLLGDLGLDIAGVEPLTRKGETRTLTERAASRHRAILERFESTARDEIEATKRESVKKAAKERNRPKPNMKMIQRKNVTEDLPLFDGAAVQREPGFAAWFSESVVSDGHGNPKVVYHGTDAEEDFKTFDVDRGEDIGIHFGTLEQATARIGMTGPVMRDILRYGLEPHQEGRRIIPAYLSIKNPLRLPDMNEWGNPSEWLKRIDKVPEQVRKQVRSLAKQFAARPELEGGGVLPEGYEVVKLDEDEMQASGRPYAVADVRKRMYMAYGMTERQARETFFAAYPGRQEGFAAFSRSMRGLLRAAGYDGVMYKNEHEFRSSRGTSYIVFDHNQIRSSITGDAMSVERKSAPVFYSPLTRAIDGMKLKVAIPGDEFLNKVRGLPGVKAQEIEETGFEDWLQHMRQTKQPVSREAALDFMRENGVKVETVEKGQRHTFPSIEVQEAATARFEQTKAIVAKWKLAEMDTPEYRRAVQDFQDAEADMRLKVPGWGIPPSGETTKFSEYAPPGGVPGTYREVLLTLPTTSTRPPRLDVRQNVLTEQWQIWNEDTQDWQEGTWPTEEEAESAMRVMLPEGDNSVGGGYRSPHWPDTPNVIAHMLIDERRIPLEELTKTDPLLAARLRAAGKTEARALHMIEGQSDWHQQGAAKGYADRGTLPEGYTVRPIPETDPAYVSGWNFRVHRADGEGTISVGATERAAIANYWEHGGPTSGSIPPPGPFRGNAWKRLVIRSMLRQAADGGYDLLTWSTGQDRAKQWGSERVEWKRNPSDADLSASEIEARDAKRREVFVEYEARIKALNAKITSPEVMQNQELWQSYKQRRDELERFRDAVADTKGGKVVPPTWTVSAIEQAGGTLAGQNIEDIARERGILLEKHGKTVRTKDDLRDLVRSIMRDEDFSRGKMEKLVDRAWERMQNEPEGTLMPRREFFEFLYDKSFVNEANDIVRRMDKTARVGEAGFLGEGDDGTHMATTDDVREYAHRGGYYFANGRGEVLTPMEAAQAVKSGDRSVTAVPQASPTVGVHALPITEAMKDVVSRGQPMWASVEREKPVEPGAPEPRPGVPLKPRIEAPPERGVVPPSTQARRETSIVKLERAFAKEEQRMATARKVSKVEEQESQRRQEIIDRWKNDRIDLAEKSQALTDYARQMLPADAPGTKKVLTRINRLAQLQQPDARARVLEEGLAVIDVITEEHRQNREHRKAFNDLRKTVGRLRKHGVGHFEAERKEAVRGMLGEFTFKRLADDQAIADAVEEIKKDPILSEEMTDEERAALEGLLPKRAQDMTTDELKYMTWNLSRVMADQKEARRAAHSQRESEAEVDRQVLLSGIRQRRGVDLSQRRPDEDDSWLNKYLGTFLPTDTIAYQVDGAEDEGPAQRYFVHNFYDGTRRNYSVLKAVADHLRAAIPEADLNLEAMVRPTTRRKIRSGKEGTPKVYTLESGQELPLYEGEQISMYLHSLNPDNVRHITDATGGVVLEDNPGRYPSIRLTAEDLHRIARDVESDPRLLRIARAYHQVFNGILKGFLNSTSQGLHAEELADVENYFPIIVSRLHTALQSLDNNNITPADIQDVMRISVETMGPLKRRMPGAKSPVMLYDVFTMGERSTRVAALYHGYAEPIDRMRRFLKPQQEASPEGRRRVAVGSVEAAIRAGYGDTYWEALRSIGSAYETRRQQTKAERQANNFLNTMTRGILAFNLPVVFIQPASYVTASAFMPMKYWTAALASAPATWDEMGAASPILWARSKGNQSIATEQLMGQAGRVAEIGLAGIMAGDRQAIGRIFNAAKMQARDEHPGASDADIAELAARKTEQVIWRTQSTSEQELRSMAQRDPSAFFRGVMRFTSERTKLFDVLARTMIERKANKIGGDEALKRLLVLLVSAIFVAGVRTFSRFLYHRGEDKHFAYFLRAVLADISSFGGRGTEAALDAIYAVTRRGYQLSDPFNQILMDSFTSIGQGVSGVREAIAGDRYESGEKRFERKAPYTLLRAGEQGARVAGTVSGTGVHNILEPVEALVKHGVDLFGEERAPRMKKVSEKRGLRELQRVQ